MLQRRTCFYSGCEFTSLSWVVSRWRNSQCHVWWQLGFLGAYFSSDFSCIVSTIYKSNIRTSCRRLKKKKHLLIFLSWEGMQTRGMSNLQRREVVINEKREATDRNDQKLHSERVVVSIIRRFELHVDQVQGGIRTSDIDHLKDKMGKSHSLALCPNSWRRQFSISAEPQNCVENLWGTHQLFKHQDEQRVPPSWLYCRRKWRMWAGPSSEWWRSRQTGSDSFRKFLTRDQKSVA